MKNKQDTVVGIITIIATIGAMIFSLNYTSKALAENAKKNTVPIIINKKDLEEVDKILTRNIHKYKVLQS